MTDPSRYDQLSPLARALVDDFDELDLAEMLVRAQDELAAHRAGMALDAPLRDQLQAAIKALGKSETENADLRARVATLEHVAAGNKRHVQLIVPDLERAETTIVRVRAELDRVEDFAKQRDDSTTVPYLDAVDALRTALDQPTPAATEATEHHYLSTGCLHDQHDYCKSMTGLNGAKRPGSCKHCEAKCQCSCHAEVRPGAPNPRSDGPDA